MSDIKFKELEFDNVFDFCEVIQAIGGEEILSSVDPIEIQNMSFLNGLMLLIVV